MYKYILLLVVMFVTIGCNAVEWVSSQRWVQGIVHTIYSVFKAFPFTICIAGFILLVVIVLTILVITNLFSSASSGSTSSATSNYFQPSDQRSTEKSMDAYQIRELENRKSEWRRTLEHQIGRSLTLKAKNGSKEGYMISGKVEQVDADYVVIHQTDPYDLHQWIALENITRIDSS